MMDVETFRAKVLVILSEAVDHPLSIGHAARRITELYATERAATEAEIPEIIADAHADALTLCADESAELYVSRGVDYEDAERVKAWLYDMANRDEAISWTVQYNMHTLRERRK